jgi:hypothetical protein
LLAGVAPLLFAHGRTPKPSASSSGLKTQQNR